MELKCHYERRPDQMGLPAICGECGEVYKGPSHIRDKDEPVRGVQYMEPRD